MTNLLQTLNDFHRISVGFDDVFNRLHSTTSYNTQSYPPYNIVKSGDNTYSIEIAVAGFSQDDLDVTLHKGLLTVSGEITSESNNNFLYRGIATRKFERSWQLADSVEVSSAEVKNGLLTINLEQHIPEEDKPQKIAIAYQQ
jgi:molecular chaperone IbpA